MITLILILIVAAVAIFVYFKGRDANGRFRFGRGLAALVAGAVAIFAVLSDYVTGFFQ